RPPQASGDDLVRRLAEGRGDAHGRDVPEAGQVVQAAAADDADGGCVGHESVVYHFRIGRSTMADDIDRLQSDGRHAEAAAAGAERGEHARAAAISERIWDFTRAAAEARLAGDLRAALRNLLDARSLDAAAALGRELAGAGQARAAAETFEARRVWDQAGAPWGEAGGDERAAGARPRGRPPRAGARAPARPGRP